MAEQQAHAQSARGGEPCIVPHAHERKDVLRWGTFGAADASGSCDGNGNGEAHGGVGAQPERLSCSVEGDVASKRMRSA